MVLVLVPDDSEKRNHVRDITEPKRFRETTGDGDGRFAGRCLARWRSRGVNTSERVFDTRDLPFSHVEADSSGRCTLVPGLYIATVGTLRDGRKWPSRDRRGGGPRRDLISFPVFNPLTVGRMIRGAQRLGEVAALTDRSRETAIIDGAEIKRVLLRSGKKRYLAQAELYLRGRIVNRLASYPDDDLAAMLGEVLAAEHRTQPAGHFRIIAGLDVAGKLAALVLDVEVDPAARKGDAMRNFPQEVGDVRGSHKVLGVRLEEPTRIRSHHPEQGEGRDPGLRPRGGFLNRRSERPLGLRSRQDPTSSRPSRGLAEGRDRWGPVPRRDRGQKPAVGWKERPGHPRIGQGPDRHHRTPHRNRKTHHFRQQREDRQGRHTRPTPTHPPRRGGRIA